MNSIADIELIALKDDFDAAQASGNTAMARKIAFSAVHTAFLLRASVPEWASEEFLNAVGDFNNGKVKSISDAFGIPPHKHLQTRQREAIAPLLAGEVRRLRDGGETAAAAQAIVADRHAVSPATVKRIVEDHEALLRRARKLAKPAS